MITCTDYMYDLYYVIAITCFGIRQGLPAADEVHQISVMTLLIWPRADMKLANFKERWLALSLSIPPSCPPLSREIKLWTCSLKLGEISLLLATLVVSYIHLSFLAPIDTEIINIV